MTALSDFDRLEAPGLWRVAPGAQRRDVVVSIGDATLAIYDGKQTALAHWSLPAVERRNPGGVPAIYAPGADAEDELELSDETMIAAIEKVRSVIARRRPHRGRLRHLIMAATLVGAVALGVLWLPGAMVDHAVRVVPDAVRNEIGGQMLVTIRRVAGTPCETTATRAILDRLARRVLGDGAPRLTVVGSGVAEAAHVPGGHILINAALIEDHESPDPLAGYILAEAERAATLDPLQRLLQSVGFEGVFRLLTTGALPDAVLRRHAESLLSTPAPDVDAQRLLARFGVAGISVSPYAYARDITGESVLSLIESDPVPVGQGRQILTDGDWVALQSICGE